MGLVHFLRRHRAATSITAVVVVAALAFGLSWFQPWKLWTDTRVDEAIPVVAEAALTMGEPPGTTTSGPGVTVPSLAASDAARPTSSAPASPDPQHSSTSASDTSKSATSSPTTAPLPRSTPSPSAGVTAGSTAPGSTATQPKPEAAQLLSGTLISHEHETSGAVRVIERADGTRVLTLENLMTSDGPDVHVWLAAAPVIPGRDGWYVFDDQTHVDLGRLKGNLGNQVYEIPPEVDLDRLSNVSLWCERFAVSFGAAELV